MVDFIDTVAMGVALSEDRKPPKRNSDSLIEIIGEILSSFIIIGLVILVAYILIGCTSYSGGKIVDGYNIDIGVTIPGTEWSLNVLTATSGVVVKGNDQTAMFVTNTVVETNNYFGIIETCRNNTLTARIEPTESAIAGAGDGTTPEEKER